MRCIFCLADRQSSQEHIFPTAIGGGCLTINRVCADCNSRIGGRIDSSLTECILFTQRRAELGLEGRSGAVPQLHDILTGVHRLAANPGQKVRAVFNDETKRIDLYLIPFAEVTKAGDDQFELRLEIDASQMSEIPKLIQRAWKRAGMGGLSDEQLNHILTQVNPAMGCKEVINPTVNIRLSFNFSFIEHAIAKIAYELAFRWLGEKYLDDPTGVKIREAINSNDPDTRQQLQVRAGEAHEFLPFALWTPDKNDHVALTTCIDGVLYVAVRIFNILYGILPISAVPVHYGMYGVMQDKFLALDPVCGVFRESLFCTEVGRLLHSDPSRMRYIHRAIGSLPVINPSTAR